MSTRAAIVRPTDNGGFVGRYHHWDGYPDGLGATLFWAYKDHFGADLKAMLKYLIDDHPAGWSTINGKDLSLAPGFRERAMNGVCLCGEPQQQHLCQYIKPHGLPLPCSAGTPSDTYAMHLGHTYEPNVETQAAEAIAERTPECYCHGERAEEANEITEKSAAGSGCEWVYVLKDTPDGAFMLVLSSYTDIGSETGAKDEKMIGFFGMGDDNAVWKPVAVVGLDQNTEPDWEAITNAMPMEVGA